MSRYQRVTTLRLSETKFAKRKYKNSFYLRRNRARRAGSATEEFEAEIKAAFDKRIGDAILEINKTCDLLLEDERLDIPVTIVARGQGNKSKPITLSKKVPSSSPPLKRNRSNSDSNDTDGVGELAFVASLKYDDCQAKRQKTDVDNQSDAKASSEEILELDLNRLMEDIDRLDDLFDRLDELPSTSDQNAVTPHVTMPVPPPPPPPAIFDYGPPAPAFMSHTRAIAACEQQPETVDTYDDYYDPFDYM